MDLIDKIEILVSYSTYIYYYFLEDIRLLIPLIGDFLDINLKI